MGLVSGCHIGHRSFIVSQTEHWALRISSKKLNLVDTYLHKNSMYKLIQKCHFRRKLIIFFIPEVF